MRQACASVRALAALALAASSQVALAVPADAHLVIAPGTDRLLPVDFAVQGVFARPQGAVQVETMPAGEVYLRVPADAPDEVLVFAYSAYRLHAWTVCVAADEADCRPASDPKKAAKACPGFGPATEDDRPVWKGAVKTAACHAALVEHLRRARISARDLRLVMEDDGFRAMFQGIVAAVAKEPSLATMKLAFMGPTLSLTGKATRAGLETLLFLTWEHTPASVSFDADDLELLPDPAAPEPSVRSPAPGGLHALTPAPADAADVRIIEVP